MRWKKENVFLSGIKVCFEQEQGIEKTKSRCRDWMERKRLHLERWGCLKRDWWVCEIEMKLEQISHVTPQFAHKVTDIFEMTQVIIRIHYVHNLPHQLPPPRLYCLADYWGFAAGNQRSAMDYIPRLTFNVPSSNKWWEMDERRREREQEECEDKAAACRWILGQLMVCGYMRHCVCACEHVPKCLCLSKSSSCHQEQDGMSSSGPKQEKGILLPGLQQSLRLKANYSIWKHKGGGESSISSLKCIY